MRQGASATRKTTDRVVSRGFQRILLAGDSENFKSPAPLDENNKRQGYLSRQIAHFTKTGTTFEKRKGQLKIGAIEQLCQWKVSTNVRTAEKAAIVVVFT